MKKNFNKIINIKYSIIILNNLSIYIFKLLNYLFIYNN